VSYHNPPILWARRGVSCLLPHQPPLPGCATRRQKGGGWRGRAAQDGTESPGLFGSRALAWRGGNPPPSALALAWWVWIPLRVPRFVSRLAQAVWILLALVSRLTRLQHTGVHTIIRAEASTVAAAVSCSAQFWYSRPKVKVG
jgi:hypothetical protein